MALRQGMCITVVLFILCVESHAKLSGVNGASADGSSAAATPDEAKTPKRMPPPPQHDGAALLFADELKMTLERYLFGICPQTFKMIGRNKNATSSSCDLDAEQEDLAGRFATLALRAHSAARADCSRFGAALANTLGELARTAASRHATATNEANKKRKLSKSQKAKIQAKQRTAMAVKKKAAAAAAAAAAKMATV